MHSLYVPKEGVRCMFYNSKCLMMVFCPSTSRDVHPDDIKFKKRSLGGTQFQGVIYAIKF